MVIKDSLIEKIYKSLRKVVLSTLEEEIRCLFGLVFPIRQWKWWPWECGALILTKDILCILLDSSIGLTMGKTKEAMGESEALSKHPLAQHQLGVTLGLQDVSPQHLRLLMTEWRYYGQEIR